MKRPSLTLIVSGIFVAYISHSAWVMYTMFFPKTCEKQGNCINSYLMRNPKLEFRVYTSQKQTLRSSKNLKLVWKNDNFSVSQTTSSEFNISLPLTTRNNGTLFAHVFVYPHDLDPFQYEAYRVHAVIPMTSYAIPKSQTFNLLQNSEQTGEKRPSPDLPISHWRPSLTINVMEDQIAFDRYALPAELYRIMRFSPQQEYLPILYLDELSNRIRDLVPINESSRKMPLKITYSPISVGKLRLWVNMQESMKQLHALGFTEKDTDEMKGIFADTNLYFLMMTFAVAALHLLFDFLAFKNDISYWKNRKDMIGLSVRVVLWRCCSTIVIFLYLMDENTSLLVLIPAGIGSIIEVWKVKKALKVTIHWSGIRPSIKFGSSSDREKETQQFDSQAMKYLSYVMYPLCICGAIYSLMYTPHKSWYSWCIQSLVNGIYAFGFLFMLPQLFVNYKLKSVAHLPWRAFMYKAFNTFIDDIFAFIITMPTAHRLACFRDDVVFLIYLYQRWLYPVDKTRVNEYGQSFDESDAKKKN